MHTVAPGPERRRSLLEQVVALVGRVPSDDTSIVYVLCFRHRAGWAR
jgi:hypothetical protein